jgi:hypothetical protein
MKVLPPKINFTLLVINDLLTTRQIAMLEHFLSAGVKADIAKKLISSKFATEAESIVNREFSMEIKGYTPPPSKFE